MTSKNYIKGYKINILDTIFQVSAKAWMTITASYAIQTAVMLAVIMIVFLGLLGQGIEELATMTNPDDIAAYLLSAFENVSFAQALPYILLALITILVVSGWGMYFTFITISKTSNNQPVKFSSVFNESMHSNVFKILGVGFLIYAIFLLGVVASVIASKVHGILTFLLIMFCLVSMFKFILIIPFMLIENLSLEQSVRLSFEQITWVRALKLFGVTLIAFFAMLIVIIGIGFLSMAFAFIPVIGQIIQFGIQIFLGSFMLALSTTVLIGLYYRYNYQLIDSTPDTSIHIEPTDPPAISL